MDNPNRLILQKLSPIRELPELAQDVRCGLLKRPRILPPKYFYDETGSRLFEQICDTPEYYPTRTEAGLLKSHAGEIIEMVRPDHIIELGSGSSRKTRYLLDACDNLGIFSRYWPLDVCGSILRDAGIALTRMYPWLIVEALVGDYNAGLQNLPVTETGRRMFVFLGSTIGNFDNESANQLIGEIGSLMHPNDYLLLGADRHKEASIISAAYNDEAGVTAAFNKNVLNVLNRELSADFDLEGFDHGAEYNAEDRQVEMRLHANRSQAVTLQALNERISLEKGESILTEISRKFTPGMLTRMMAAGGLQVHSHYEAGDSFYSLLLAEKMNSGLQ